MNIDIRTLVLFYLVANALNSGLLFLIWRLYRKHYDGLFFLLGNMCFQTIGSYFLLLRGSIPDDLSIIASSLFSVSGMLFALKGMERFFNREKRRVYNYVLITIFSILIVYFATVNDNMVIRNICASGMTILIAWQACVLLFKEIGVDFRRIARFTAFTSLAYGILSIGRIAALFLVPQTNNEFFSSGIVNSISMIIYGSLNILYTAGLIMMVSSRLLGDVQTEKDKYSKAFHSAPYLLFLTRAADGKIFEVNEGFVKATGYQPEEVIGKTTLDVGLWTDPQDRAAFVSDLNLEEDVHEKEVKFRIKSGAILTGLLSAKRISTFGEDCILASVSDITEMIKIKERLEEIALHDSLTGLPNRKLFYDRAGIAFANARREKSNVAVVSLDVDRLKSINDQWGHAAGDHVLVTVSSRLRNMLRKGDTVARFGGDEFLILLNGIVRPEDINRIVKKMTDGISEPILFEGKQIAVSASVGIALYPSDDSGIEELIRKSDEAMYYIKEHGRNGFMHFCDMEQAAF